MKRQQRTITQDDLISVKATSKLLGVSSTSLRRWIIAGRVETPSVRTPGGQRRYTGTQIIRILEQMVNQ